MLSQKLQNKQPTPLQGVGLVLVIALAAVAGSAFFTRLTPRLGSLASLLFIAYGCAIAYFLLNWYGMSFLYTATDDCLRLCRAYGKRERFMADVWLNQVVAYGTPEEIKQKAEASRRPRHPRHPHPVRIRAPGPGLPGGRQGPHSRHPAG